jgi:hypothetical protein
MPVGKLLALLRTRGSGDAKMRLSTAISVSLNINKWRAFSKFKRLPCVTHVDHPVDDGVKYSRAAPYYRISRSTA